MTTLREIREMAEKGCFDDLAMIESIITEFVSTPFGELLRSGTGAEENIYEVLAAVYDLEEKRLDEITYPEAVCLTENLVYVMDPERSPYGPDFSAEQMKRFVTSLIKIAVLASGKRNLLIKEFLAVDVFSMFQFFESRNKAFNAESGYGRFLTIRGRIRGSKEAGRRIDSARTRLRWNTIGSVLQNTTNISHWSWRSWESIKDYESILLMASEMDEDILISGFAKAYREKMDLKSTTDRFSWWWKLDGTFEETINSTDAIQENEEKEN